MNIRAKLKSAYRKLVEQLTRMSAPTGWEPLRLKPDVQAAFIVACAPLPPRRETPSVMGRTSKGKNWYPRGQRWMLTEVDLPEALRLPKRSPFEKEVTLHTGRVYLMRHGTLERVDRLFPAAE